MLKTEPAMWVAIRDGRKTAEFRRDDRGFEVGDVLQLCYGSDLPIIEKCVSHIVRGPAFGIPAGFAMLSLQEPVPAPEDPIMKYRKKPVVIEVIRVREARHNAQHSWSSNPKWLNAAYENGDIFYPNDPPRMEVRTLEGLMTASIDDWLIRGVKGEIHPCKPDIFEATYEPAEATS